MSMKTVSTPEKNDDLQWMCYLLGGGGRHPKLECLVHNALVVGALVGAFLVYERPCSLVRSLAFVGLLLLGLGLITMTVAANCGGSGGSG